MKLSLFLSFILTLSCQAQNKPFGQLKDEETFKDYTVRIYRNEFPYDGTNTEGPGNVACFEILKAGKQVFFKKGWEFAVGNISDNYNGKTNVLITIGKSINSDKKPNLVVSEWTGGAHCCYNFYIFQIGEKFRCIAYIETEHGSYSDFADLRKDGNLELVMHDWTFAYWNAGFANSPAPEVILSYQDHMYLPDLKLMSKPAPTEQEVESWAKGFKAEFSDPDVVDVADDQKWSAPSDLWGKMLDLIYSGNATSAWKLCDLSWPPDHPGKGVFLKEFKRQLKTSPYYDSVNRPDFQKE